MVTGVSVGAINAAGVSLFGKGEEQEMVDYLIDLWMQLTSDQVWRWWPSWCPVDGITKEPGFVDNSPLFNLLTSIFEGKQVKKRVIVSANDANSGSYIPMQLHDTEEIVTSTKYKVSAVVGSASMPFVFPPRDMKEFGLPVLLIDGGSSWNNNMISGIEECFKLPGINSYDQIVVDVMSLDSANLDTYDPEADELLQDLGDPTFETQTMRNYFRKNAVVSYYKSMDDIIEFMNIFPTVSYRYFVMADNPLMHEYKILDFVPTVAAELIERGKQDAIKVINMGEGKSF